MIEIPTTTKQAKARKLPTLRARYALALVELGAERVLTANDQKRLLAGRLVTMTDAGALAVTVAGYKLLHGVD